MAFKRISPQEAKQLMDSGYVYVDVRSVREFDQGHPAGARNVPLMHMGPSGSAPNHDFVRVMEASFARDAKLVVGCKAGIRSQRAAMMLEAVGFTALVEMRGGYSGEADAMGRLVEAGWATVGLPVEGAAQPGASWEELKAKAT